MSYCPQCGAEVPEGMLRCPSCGAQQPAGAAPAPQQPAAQPGYQQQYQPCYQPQPVNDSGSFGWAVLGFFIPVVGLVLYLVWRNEKPKCAKKAGLGALVSVILGVVLGVVSACASAVLLASLQ